MYKFVCEENTCTGCRACADICPRNAIRIEEKLDRVYACIDKIRCVDCDLCMYVCPNRHPADTVESIAWKQGWCESAAGRQKSASGGVATALAEEVIREGGIVAGCFFREGRFRFGLAGTMDELEAFRGSKYVKSDPTGIYKEINQQLQAGMTVLFVGLPCQVAALKNYVKAPFSEKLITIDLICHGTPTQEMLSYYLKQHGKNMESVNSIAFRRGNDFRLYIDGEALIHPRVQDTYTFSFLKSLNYTENCYHCQYAKSERVGDITLGDSWGSCLPEEEQRKGISLVLCQTEKGLNLTRKAALHLDPVDLQTAIKNNHQLRHPAEIPEIRDTFLKTVKSGGNYDWAVARVYPKACAKLALKRMIVQTIDILKFSKN